MRTSAFFAVGMIMLLSAFAEGASIEVSSNLQAAIDAAASGDTIQVAPGVYDRITISKSLNLVGFGAIIRAGERDACVSIEADQVGISGFVVRDGFYGIKLNNAKGCRIANNTVIHCTQPGIALLYSDNNIIEGNNASFNGLGGEGWYGIYLSNSNGNMIVDNVANNNGAYGIDLFPSCNNNTIRGNILEKNMYGLYMFTDCADNLIEENVMSRNTNSGLDMRFNCHDNLVLNNTIEENVVAGITLMSSGENIIEKNLISRNGRYGLQVQSGSSGNTIINNTISDSQTGIFLDGTSNRIYGNTIAENVVQAEDRDANIWYADYSGGGNLWSDYIGKDEMSGPDQNVPGEDGFGDEPYRINERAADLYPIMGNQVRRITVTSKSVSPPVASIGDNIDIEVELKSKYEIAQVTARAFSSDYDSSSKGYSRLTKEGHVYQGKLSTGLMDPGSYQIVLSAQDIRGYELKEILEEIEISARGSRRNQ